MLSIKLIGFDFDGTILEAGGVSGIIPKDAQEVLDEAILRGVKITTASGRPPDEQLGVLEHSNLGAAKGWPHFLITNESQIYFLHGNFYESLESWNSMVRDKWIQLLPLARQILLEELEKLQKSSIKAKRHISDEIAKSRNMIDLWFDHVEDARAFEKNLSNRLKTENEELCCNRNYCLVQILYYRTGKGNTVARLAEHLGLQPENVLVVGDSDNDINMLDGHLGFLSATVSNADPAVKECVAKCGGYVVSQPVSKGFIEIVKKLVLNE